MREKWGGKLVEIQIAEQRDADKRSKTDDENESDKRYQIMPDTFLHGFHFIEFLMKKIVLAVPDLVEKVF